MRPRREIGVSTRLRTQGNIEGERGNQTEGLGGDIRAFVQYQLTGR
jgi:hypothetical protein